MSYPQFNLTTLQLPAPASNMTKAEYKAAYGIDLDEVNIKAFKLVLLGNEKYAIDQIKEVEDGYEIYFNGRILSVTDTIQTSDEVYDVANSKPIYCHPIIFYNDANIVIETKSYRIRCSALIFNNSESTLAGKLTNVKSYVVGKFTRLIVSGTIVNLTDNVETTLNQIFFSEDGNHVYACGMQEDGTLVDEINNKIDLNLDANKIFVADGVNKIN